MNIPPSTRPAKLACLAFAVATAIHAEEPVVSRPEQPSVGATPSIPHAVSVPAAPVAQPPVPPAPEPLPPALPGDHPVTDATLNTVAHDLNGQLSTIRQSIDDLSKTTGDKWLSALMGFLGVLAGAGITGGFGVMLQRWRLNAEKDADDRKAKRERRQAERDFGLAALADLQAFRARQLNEFYGPFRVLLSQIRILRDEFDQRLVASLKPGSEIRLELQGIGRRRHLVIERPDTPTRGFRLIDEMAFIQKEYPDLMSTVGEIVSTGDLLANHLHKNGGLLDPRSIWLGKHIAVYLAHQRVLKEIFERVKKDQDARWVANYSTVYPRTLDLLIERDYRRLYRSQSRWTAQAATWSEAGY